MKQYFAKTLQCIFEFGQEFDKKIIHIMLQKPADFDLQHFKKDKLWFSRTRDNNPKRFHMCLQIRWDNYILRPSSNWSPYIFKLAQKVRNRAYIIHAFINGVNTLPRLCKLFHLKMTWTSCTDEAREKVPSFQKVTLFLRYKS